ncbi:TetR/AcrR family transcriptional regulator [Nocardia sp. NPDC050718]|uniref:TetR/AcrR family transcriptional regulator n=1 Tax=Nocardia sp. NPDC050718 TaxID=3155788 RepID=UPI0033FE9CDE
MRTSKSAGGRPRESRVDTAIAAAVTGVLAESGYAALTVDAVAARAGVSKATIYRRFATKQEMTFAVVLHDLDEAPPADTGTLEGDLGALIERIGEQLSRSGSDVMTGLLADIRADATLTERFTTTYLAVERSVIGELLDRAIARGDLTRRPDPAITQALLLGPLFAWIVVLDEDPARAPELARIVARMVSDALAAGVVPADPS